MQRGAVLAGAGPFLLVVGAGSARGGYFPGSWGWLTLASAWAAALVLILDDRAGISRLGMVSLASLTGFTGWTLLSVVWSADVTASVLEAQRVLVYAAALAGGLLVCRRAPRAFLAGLWAGVWALSTYGLLTKLLPDRIGVYDSVSGGRLSQPIGYWNSFGVFAAMGVLLAIGFIARGGPRLRLAAAVSVPLLLVTQYLTFSRGAAISLGCALVIMFVLEPQRLRLFVRVVAVGGWSAAAIWLAAHAHGLTTLSVTLAAASRDGHRLALELLALAAGAALSVWALDRLESRVAISPRTHRRLGAAIVAALAFGLLGTFVAFGAPWTLSQRAWHDFSSDIPAGGANLTHHFYTLHTSRVVAWRVALDVRAAHPWLGDGAGTYERNWLLVRGDQTKLRDAHSLYLQTLAEVGPIGLLLLVGAFGAALWAGVRRRRENVFAVPVTAALVAFLVHVSGDWDWQVVAVTIVALLCAAYLLAGDEEPSAPPAAHRGRRVLLALIAAAALAGVYGIAEQLTLARIGNAGSDVAKAESAARTASDLAPWSTDPWQKLGETATDDSQFAVARTALHRAVAKDPHNWQLWFDLARASSGLPLIDALRKAEALNPHSPEIEAFRQQLIAGYNIAAGR
ncbi:MAG TPA: O-antigen ligase family protein [Gaiellaceae bacterium]|nr:O-antigen ligase family protein [Gaiellaceae bacterium]